MSSEVDSVAYQGMEPLSSRATRPSEPRYAHHPGCYKTSWGNAWFVQFSYHGERVYLGTFATEEEAIAAKQAYLTWVIVQSGT